MGIKFEELFSFEKHLRESSSSCILAAVSSDLERKKILERALQTLSQKTEVVSKIFEGGTLTLEELNQELENRPLFGTSLLLIDALDRAKKEVKEKIAKQCLAGSTLFLLGASNLRGVSELPLKQITLLDLSAEKPWNREKRLIEALAAYAERANKHVQPPVIAYLLEQIGLEQGMLENEIEKLICFTGERKEITLEDASALCTRFSLPDGWDIAKRLVWGEEERGFFLSHVSSFEGTALPQLVGQIRYHLQMAEQFCVLTLEQSALSFPNLKPATIEQYHAHAKKLGPSLVRKRIIALNELELAFKQKSYIDPSLHFDLFIGNWK